MLRLRRARSRARAWRRDGRGDGGWAWVLLGRGGVVLFRGIQRVAGWRRGFLLGSRRKGFERQTGVGCGDRVAGGQCRFSTGRSARSRARARMWHGRLNLARDVPAMKRCCVRMRRFGRTRTASPAPLVAPGAASLVRWRGGGRSLDG